MPGGAGLKAINIPGPCQMIHFCLLKAKHLPGQFAGACCFKEGIVQLDRVPDKRSLVRLAQSIPEHSADCLRLAFCLQRQLLQDAGQQVLWQVRETSLGVRPLTRHAGCSHARLNLCKLKHIILSVGKSLATSCLWKLTALFTRNLGRASMSSLLCLPALYHEPFDQGCTLYESLP